MLLAPSPSRAGRYGRQAWMGQGLLEQPDSGHARTSEKGQQRKSRQLRSQVRLRHSRSGMRPAICTLLAGWRTIERIRALRHEQLSASTLPLGGPPLACCWPSSQALGASIRACADRPSLALTELGYRHDALLATATGSLNVSPPRLIWKGEQHELQLLPLLFRQALLAHRDDGPEVGASCVNNGLPHHEGRCASIEGCLASCAIS
jgi:hypothetical protein